jgi:hypothetical protein
VKNCRGGGKWPRAGQLLAASLFFLQGCLPTAGGEWGERGILRACFAGSATFETTLMHALSLYLDASVIGGYFDSEFMADTRARWRLRNAGHFRFVSSVLVDQEIARAPEQVRTLLRATVFPGDMLPMTTGVMELAGTTSRTGLCRLPTRTMRGMSRSVPSLASITS